MTKMTKMMIETQDMYEHFVQSNLIEGVTDIEEIPKSEKAWEYLMLCNELTKQSILDVHRLIITGLLEQNIGVYRPYNVQVRGRSCPFWFQVPELMDTWTTEMTKWLELDPKEMHVKFEHIHPFVDGNGRVGRMLLWWHEVKQGKEPTLVTYADRFSYYDWFEQNWS